MTDKKLENPGSRRTFIKNSVKYCLPSAIAFNAIFSQTKCKKTPTGPDPGPDPGPVSGNIIYFNHTQGEITRVSYSGLSGNSKTISVTDINNASRTARSLNQNVANVDSSRIAVRLGDNGQNMGTFAGFSRNGSVSIELPDSSMDLHVFLMNAFSGADYGKIDYWVDQSFGFLEFNPNAEWHREDKDGRAGPEGPINDAIKDLQKAIQYSWLKYGSLTKKIDGNGDFGVGYRDCPPNVAGTRTGDWAGVCLSHPIFSSNNELFMLKIFLEEIFETMTRTKDIYDNKYTTYQLITDPTTGHLNEIGRDLFAYVFVKDKQRPS